MKVMFTSLKGFVFSVGDWAASGFEMASDEEVFIRSCHCSLCEFWEAKPGRCAKCGCYSMKQKLKTSKCPIGRW